MNKKQALAKFLNESVDDISEESYDPENAFNIGSQEYLVLTDEEADEKAKEYILDTVWAFNADFIIEHSKALDYDKASNLVVKAIAEQCESGNEAMKKLIDDLDEFVEEAISADGRGQFLSSYDGNENEEGNFYIYRTN